MTATSGGSSTAGKSTNTCAREREDPIVRTCTLGAAPRITEVVVVTAQQWRLRSEEGGAKLAGVTAIRPSKLGFAVVAHRVDPDTAWFIPAVKDERASSRRQASSSRAPRRGGASRCLRNGLPSVTHRYGLRHALAVRRERRAARTFGSTKRRDGIPGIARQLDPRRRRGLRRSGSCGSRIVERSRSGSVRGGMIRPGLYTRTPRKQIDRICGLEGRIRAWSLARRNGWR